MNVLSINTAFSDTNVTVQTSDMVKTKQMNSSLKQSENLLGVIDECLASAQISLNQIDVISCVIGPGSFTGIRIGASMAKGFCFALKNIKKIQINSLDLLAYSFVKKYKPNQDFWVLINALSGNLFARKYDCSGKPIQQPAMVFGEELSQISGIVVGLMDENLSICNEFISFSCEDLGEYTNRQIELGNFSDDFEPLYLRKSQAEAELEKKNKD